MAKTKRYDKSLGEIERYLLSVGDRVWAPVLEQWRKELASELTDEALKQHVQRSIKATGGMGSLGDFSISAANGHRIRDDLMSESTASARLWRMTEKLYDEAKQVLDDLGGDTSRR